MTGGAIPKISAPGGMRLVVLGVRGLIHAVSVSVLDGATACPRSITTAAMTALALWGSCNPGYAMEQHANAVAGFWRWLLRGGQELLASSIRRLGKMERPHPLHAHNDASVAATHSRLLVQKVDRCTPTTPEGA